MVTSPAQKGRSSVACKACHGQKLKCNGGTPCQRCQVRRRECVYPVKEKFTTVSESYLRMLEKELASVRRGSNQSPSNPSHAPEPVQTDVRSSDFAAPMSPPKTSRIIKEEMPEDCSTEKFFHTLLSRKEKYTYSRLKFDFLHPEVHLRLPPRPYAFHLLQAFEEGFSEYHWFLRKDFRDRLMLTYSDPSSQSKDRNWLCRVSVVLALAESFNRSRMTASTHMQLTGEQPPSPYGILPPLSSSPTSNSESSETPQAPPPPPGSDYFEQGLMLLKMSSEEPVSEDVEALNLIGASPKAKFGYWESLHLFSGLSILALARVSLNFDRVSSPSSEDHDVALYSRTRELLREMARVGNPAAKDHDALLSDVEAMVMRVQEEERLAEQTTTEIETPNENSTFSDFMFADMGSEQQIWCDTDWENILSSYTQGI
uniref:C6 transcription factor n=1 Tax=Colletotrichum fructicola (strain Nara gc5) TaxID=1213859 RepID=L2FKB1_COLFN